MANSRRLTLYVLVPVAALLLIGAFLLLDRNPAPAAASSAEAATGSSAVPDDSSLKKATFAGGCFWCMESAFQDAPGVKAAVSGFSGGTKPDPTYNQVSSGTTDYAESVQVTYDPDTINYQQLLYLYWHDINPTDGGGQFADRGSQYRPVIFYHNQRQQRLAEQSKKDLAENGPFEDPIAVKIEAFNSFYAAEDYHQDYYKTHSGRYKRYFEGSGRAPFLRKTWGAEHPSLDSYEGPTADASASEMESSASASSSSSSEAPWKNFEKPSDQVLRQQLTSMQYDVTQRDGTEPAYHNKYYDNTRPGIYVDIVSGEPLFSSKAKFHSGTGWPSFYKPLEPKYVVEKTDRSAGMVRTEVRSKLADSHLGHIFDWNGHPKVPTGKRYCLDSAALEFIPADQLKEKGYGEYASLFTKTADSGQ